MSSGTAKSVDEASGTRTNCAWPPARKHTDIAGAQRKPQPTVQTLAVTLPAKQLSRVATRRELAIAVETVAAVGCERHADSLALVKPRGGGLVAKLRDAPGNRAIRSI